MGAKGSVSPDSWVKFHDSPIVWEKKRRNRFVRSMTRFAARLDSNSVEMINCYIIK